MLLTLIQNIFDSVYFSLHLFLPFNMFRLFLSFSLFLIPIFNLRLLSHIPLTHSPLTSLHFTKVRGIGKTFDTLGPSVFKEIKTLTKRPVSNLSADSTHSVYFDGIGRIDNTPIFLLDKLEVGDVVKGPAMIIDNTQTIVLIPGAEAVLCRKHLYITLQ